MTKITLDSQQMSDLAVGLGCAVRWYAEAVAVYADAGEDPAHHGRRIFQAQLDRLRELEKLLTSNPTGIVEVSRYPTP
jgi:hypothetical protein